MEFEDVLKNWIRESINQNIPKNVKALSFNLFECSSNYFSIELIGTSYFDKHNSDWACDEIWEPESRSMSENFTANNCQDCLKKIKTILIPLIQKEMNVPKNAHIIAVGVGFVDGDLDIIYERF